MPCVADAGADAPPVKPGTAMMTYTPLMFGSKTLGQPLVKVRLNKTIEATFLVDTGTLTSIISETLAKKLGLHLEPAIADDGKPVNLFKYHTLMGRVSSLAIGDISGAELTGTDQLLIVADEKTLNLGPVTHYDGIIGANILERAVILLNPRDHTLIFGYPGNCSPDRLRYLGMTSPYVLPMSRDKINAVWYSTIKFTNDSRTGEERLKIDTGSDRTIISASLAKQLRLIPTDRNKVINYDGPTTLDVAKVASAVFGDLILSNFPIEYQSDPHVVSTPILGLDALSGYLILIDFPGGKLYLQPYPSTVPAITIGPAPAPVTPPAK